MELLPGIVFSMAQRLCGCEQSHAKGSICVAFHAGCAGVDLLLTNPYPFLGILDEQQAEKNNSCALVM